MLTVPYETVNILEDDALRQGMKEFSQWPTFPQVYIDGEFFGGCDILIGAQRSCSLSLSSEAGLTASWCAESFQSGELQETLEALLNS